MVGYAPGCDYADMTGVQCTSKITCIVIAYDDADSCSHYVCLDPSIECTDYNTTAQLT